MDWKNAYIIVRADENGNASIVHSADKMKDARYWLTYIALPGDAMFQTPLHPKCEGRSEPAYQCHLVKRGTTDTDEQKWKTQFLKGQPLQFVETAAAA